MLQNFFKKWKCDIYPTQIKFIWKLIQELSAWEYAHFLVFDLKVIKQLQLFTEAHRGNLFDF